jgi:hypothetical protein
LPVIEETWQSKAEQNEDNKEGESDSGEENEEYKEDPFCYPTKEEEKTQQNSSHSSE